jgi:hypothetical protein
MDTIIEKIWKEDADRKKRIRMLLLLVALVMTTVCVAVWAIVTQPLMARYDARHGASTNAKEVEPVRLEKHVRELSEVFVPRDWKHVENLNRTASYIREEFERAKGEVSEQEYAVNGNTYKNIIAFFGPETQERVVIGAHYDSFWEFPAADDNASGVSGLIELAYLLGRDQPPIRVELVAYTLEEPPHFNTRNMGSAVHSEALKKGGIKVRAMISLEMIGCFIDAPGSQNYPLSILRTFYPSQGNFITVVGELTDGSTVRKIKKGMIEASSLPVYSINAPKSVPGIGFSDHLNYWNSGYRAVMISDTAFYRNKNYHTAKDTTDKLDYKRMAMVIQGVYGAILEIAK